MPASPTGHSSEASSLPIQRVTPRPLRRALISAFWGERWPSLGRLSQLQGYQLLLVPATAVLLGPLYFLLANLL